MPPHHPSIPPLLGARSFERESSVVKSEARSCDFSEEGFAQADDPRKEIKSTDIYIFFFIYSIYKGKDIYVRGKRCARARASGGTVKKSKLNLTISRAQQICCGYIFDIWITYRYLSEGSKE